MKRPDDLVREEAAVLQAASLLSTLAAAAEVWRQRRDRRLGLDPSTQEDSSVAHAYVRSARKELRMLVMRLYAQQAYAGANAGTNIDALVRRFDDWLTLGRVERLLREIHQRLLSLYPDVPEALVEEARRRHREAASLLDAEDTVLGRPLVSFLDRALAFNLELDTVLE